MLALEMLGRRAHNDHPNNFSRSPPYTEDVKWLLGLAARLGECAPPLGAGPVHHTPRCPHEHKGSAMGLEDRREVLEDTCSGVCRAWGHVLTFRLCPHVQNGVKAASRIYPAFLLFACLYRQTGFHDQSSKSTQSCTSDDLVSGFRTGVC